MQAALYTYFQSSCGNKQTSSCKCSSLMSHLHTVLVFWISFTSVLCISIICAVWSAMWNSIYGCKCIQVFVCNYMVNFIVCPRRSDMHILKLKLFNVSVNSLWPLSIFRSPSIIWLSVAVNIYNDIYNIFNDRGILSI